MSPGKRPGRRRAKTATRKKTGQKRSAAARRSRAKRDHAGASGLDVPVVQPVIAIHPIRAPSIPQTLCWASASTPGDERPRTS